MAKNLKKDKHLPSFRLGGGEGGIDRQIKPNTIPWGRGGISYVKLTMHNCTYRPSQLSKRQVCHCFEQVCKYISLQNRQTFKTDKGGKGNKTIFYIARTLESIQQQHHGGARIDYILFLVPSWRSYNLLPYCTKSRLPNVFTL